MHLRREDAAEEEREEQRAGRSGDPEAPGDDARADQDAGAHPEEDDRRHRQRLGQSPPEREPRRGGEHRREHPRHYVERDSPGAVDAESGRAVGTVRARSAPPSRPVTAPPIAYGTNATTSWTSNPASTPRSFAYPRRGQYWARPESRAPTITPSPPATALRRTAKKPAPAEDRRRYPIASSAPPPSH